jgi:hypothetical protein
VNSWRRTVAVLFGYLLLAIWLTWPLPLRLTHSIVQGSESAASVPLLTTWTVWWNADRAAHRFQGYWDAPIFHPATDALAFSEPILTSVAVAPLVWSTGNSILAHNLFILASLAFNGWAALVLLQHWRVRPLYATLGGGLVVLLPVVQNELGVLQLVPLFGILATIGCLSYFGRLPTLRRSAALGAAAGITYLTCANYGVFAAVLFPAAAPFLLGRRGLELRTWGYLVTAAGVALSLTAPVIAAQLRVSREHGLVRPLELVQRLSAVPKDYLAVPQPHRFEPQFIKEHRTVSQKHLCPGLVLFGLAMIGAVRGLRSARSFKATGFCLCLLSTAVLLSFGPGFTIAGWSPYETLWNRLPGFSQVRSPFRMAVFVQLSVVLLAMIGLDELRRMVKSIGKRRMRHSFRLATLGLIAVAVAETRSTAPALFSPPIERNTAWIAWLKQHADRQTVIACLPLPETGHVRDYEAAALHMYWSTIHGCRLLNGYSGFLPEQYTITKEKMKAFPDSATVQRLRLHETRYCVINRSYLSAEDILTHPTASQELIWQFGDDDAEIDIYLLRQLK